MNFLNLQIATTLLLAHMANAATAETPITAETFEQMTEGKTFTYGNGFAPYGAEEYLPGRRVLWSFLDGRCQAGEWYMEKEQVCFIYENDTEPQCWTFFLEGGGLAARFENDPDATTLYEVDQSKDRLYCIGPDIGA